MSLPKVLRCRLRLVLTLLILHLEHEVNGQEKCSKVATFNTGLTPVVDKLGERTKHIISAMKESDSDVFCLQEVWFERSLNTLISALKDHYPHHYTALHTKVSKLPSKSKSWFSWLFPKTSCKKKEAAYIVKELGMCALSQGCIGPKPEAVGACLAIKCKEVLKSRKLTQSCLSCTLFSLSSLTSTMTECNRVVGSDNRLNGPGLVLLSKKKISSAKYVHYFPFSKLFVERGYIEAKIDDIGKVVCTHLSAHFGSYFEFDTFFKTYKSQQMAEIWRLGRFAFQEHILLGDLNTGPAITFNDATYNIESVYPSNYRRLMSFGYNNPYVKSIQLCTYCGYNHLTTKGQSHILDHILVRGRNFQKLSAKRVMAQYKGSILSDHFGTQLSFCKA